LSQTAAGSEATSSLGNIYEWFCAQVATVNRDNSRSGGQFIVAEGLFSLGSLIQGWIE
jgi:hypothetical protein